MSGFAAELEVKGELDLVGEVESRFAEVEGALRWREVLSSQSGGAVEGR